MPTRTDPKKPAVLRKAQRKAGYPGGCDVTAIREWPGHAFALFYRQVKHQNDQKIRIGDSRSGTGFQETDLV
jgi:hypothetical protein